MNKYIKVNINLEELEKDYGVGIIKGYIKHTNTNKKINNNFKCFMKTIKGITKYRMELSEQCSKYGTYILPLLDFANPNNSVDIKAFQKEFNIPDVKINRMVRKLKEANVLRKIKTTFYINPLVGFSGKDIDLKLGLLFEDELNKVGITIK